MFPKLNKLWFIMLRKDHALLEKCREYILYLDGALNFLLYINSNVTNFFVCGGGTALRYNVTTRQK
jgi:hypothetical protein